MRHPSHIGSRKVINDYLCNRGAIVWYRRISDRRIHQLRAVRHLQRPDSASPLAIRYRMATVIGDHGHLERNRHLATRESVVVNTSNKTLVITIKKSRNWSSSRSQAGLFHFLIIG